MQRLVEVQQLLALALDELCHRDAGPAFDDQGDLLVGHLVAQEVVLLGALRQFFLVFELLFRLGQAAVLELRGLFQIAGLLRALDVLVHRLDLLAQLLHLADGVFLIFPLRLHRIEAVAQLSQLLLQLGQTALRKRVLLVFERNFLDLHLDDLAADLVQLGRHGVHLRADHGARLVDQIDRLVRQEAVGDIAV